jgi:hypothetical protein
LGSLKRNQVNVIGSDSVGVQAGVQEQKFFKNPCKYWLFQGGVEYPWLHLGGNAIQPCEPLSFQQLEGCRVGVVEDGQIVHP